MIKNELKKLVEQYKEYQVLAEDTDTLYFNIVIDNITDDVATRWQFYEIDHEQKIIYLESIQQDCRYIYIVSNDELELPYTVVKNLNEAADFMNVASTHVYRADRRAGRPQRLQYNNYILIKNII